jgi:mycofactocin system glycosyltransferase
VSLDPSARLHRDAGGGLLLGGQPFRVLRLGGPAAEVLARWRTSPDVAAGAETVLARRLHGLGLAVHREPGSWTLDDVTVVVPAHERAAELGRCLAALGPVRVVVVDDCSSDPAVGRTARDAGALVVRLGHNRGPAGARNAGLRAVSTPLVAFVDSDVVVPGGWLGPLLDAMVDGVCVVAPRVVGAGGASLLARHEQGAGPLDLGPLAGQVLPGARVGHVPAAALLCRVADLGDGFDEAMRVGEDVDLVWRLAGRVRYEPQVVVTHATRGSLVAGLRQRYGYGRSAALLDARHPGVVAPVVLGRWAAPVLGAALTRRPWAVGLALGWSFSALHQQLPDGPGRALEAARLSVEGPLRSAVGLADGAGRAWLPALLPLALVSRRARVVTTLAVGTRIVRSRSGLDRVRGGGFRVVEDLAYAAGVWVGAVAGTRPRALLPRIRAAGMSLSSDGAPSRVTTRRWGR